MHSALYKINKLRNNNRQFSWQIITWLLELELYVVDYDNANYTVTLDY